MREDHSFETVVLFLSGQGPVFQRKYPYGKIKQDIANILSMLCKRKGVKIIEAEIKISPKGLSE